MEKEVLDNLDIVFRIASIGGIVLLAWYAWETFMIRKTAQQQLIYSMRPYVGYRQDPNQLTVSNESTNLALNIFLLSKLQGQYRISQEGEHLSGLSAGKIATFTRSGMSNITTDELKRRVSGITKLVDYLETKQINCLVVVYEDLNKNKLYTINYGSGDAIDQSGETDYIKNL